MDMATSNRYHVHYGVGLVPIDFYLLNKRNSKKLIEYCLKEGWIVKDFTRIDNEDKNMEEIWQELMTLIPRKNVFIHINKRTPIVSILDKGLMAVIEILKIDEE